MKILLAQNATYVPAHGGANKANKFLLEGLAARGHSCRVVAPARALPGPGVMDGFLSELASRGIRVASTSPGAVVFQDRGVEVCAVAEALQLRAQVKNQVREFEPAWTLVSSEDPGQALLEAALRASPTRVVYVAHTMLQFPFGPSCFLPSAAKTELLRRTAGILTVSRYLEAYTRRWGGLESVAIPFPVYGPGPFPQLGRFDQGYVTLINPCAYKGLVIFVALAQALPQVTFAAVPTWGTTEADRAALARLPNVQLLPPADDIDEVFAQTRVLLVPSLWGEAFGQIVVEAMLRGIPVLASDSGGLPEAKLGVDYVLPVRPIERYEEYLDARMLPRPVVPEQDVGPWLEALQELLTDRARYEGLARASREAALAFVSRIGIAPFEVFLKNLEPARRVDLARVASPARKADPETGKLLEQMSDLSPERRALLALRLREKGGAKDARYT
jgi:glycosyltransferase involved in cell wall biosynthesis